MRRFSGRERLRPPAACLFACLTILGFGVPACFEVPPVVPEGYAGSRPKAQSVPLAVYAPEPFHPANRWFQRAFAPRDARGRLGALDPAAAWSSMERGTPVDHAELHALLARIEPGRAASIEPEARRWVRADLLDEAHRWRRLGEPALADLHARAAESFDVDATPAPLPPSASVRAADEDESVLDPRRAVAGVPYRVRIQRSASRELLRASLDLFAISDETFLREVWILDRVDGAWTPRVERFDRERALRGEPAWIAFGPEDVIAVRDPFAEGHPLDRRPLGEICARCHAEYAPLRVE